MEGSAQPGAATDSGTFLKSTLTPILIATFVIGVVSLFLEQGEFLSPAGTIFIAIIDYLLVVLIVVELVVDILIAPYKIFWIRKNWLSVATSIVFIALFVYNRATADIVIEEAALSGFSATSLIVIRNFFLVFRVFGRMRRVSAFLSSLTVHPAQTMVVSFAMVVLVGSFYLMLPFTTVDGEGLNFIDALFTATSAVCVTGLIVVDTATWFTLAGKIGILLLIQIGGLGIMILSFSAAWALRRKFTLQDKLLLSYMTNEEDLSRVSRSLFSIITLTFMIEAAGGIVLFLAFYTQGMDLLEAIWYGLFHAVSAFCNAGFALFSDSLEGFRGSIITNLGICSLIILGALSFSVMSNLLDGIKHPRVPFRLSLNSKIVLTTTAILLIVGTLLIYGLEHGTSMAEYGLGEQYLTTFFQSVTLRTAGFNTLPLAELGSAAVVVCVVWMFIGGASGSTAGGIKVNTAAVIAGYLRSRFRGRSRVLMFGFTLDRATVNNSIVLFLFGIITVMTGFFLLCITEDRSFADTLFETVSAFGTVGLSRGITGGLSTPGRLIISVLMFAGRLGPLTLLTALADRARDLDTIYPEKEILIG